MNVLWDLRLFSYGYRERGVGVYCQRVAASILAVHPEISIFAWGDRTAAPESLRDAPITWIDYRYGGWKSSIVALPLLAMRYRIDLVHYWVALGPLREIGIAPFTGAKMVATVYDLGVELWNTPFGNRVKSERYWKMQKLFFGRIDGVLGISTATLDDMRRIFPFVNVPCDRVLPPLTDTFAGATRRMPFFITLCGAGHKNCSRVAAAFAMVRQKRPDYRLIVLGAIDREEEGLEALPEGVVHEAGMTNYETYMQSAAGLLFCSIFEGLGLPPIEAMQNGCPLLLSDIAPLREIAADAARFVDPYSIDSIATGIGALIDDNELWVVRSRNGAEAYRLLSADAPRRCLQMYEQLTRSKIGCRETAVDVCSKERR